MLRALLLLVVALVLTSCSSTPPATPAGADPFPPTPQVESLTLPFDAYTPSLSDMYTILNAEDVLVQRCMAERGYDFPAIQRPTDLKDLRNRRRYGVVESAIARFGYHVPVGLLSPADIDVASDSRDGSLNEGAKAAAFGPNGCGPSAAAKIQPADGSDLDLMQRLDSESLRASAHDAGVVGVLAAWRSCMRSKGLSYPDPLAAMADPTWWGSNSETPSAPEITVATADVDCKDQTHLVDAWHAADMRIQQQDVDRNAAYFQGLRVGVDKQLANARTALE